MPIRLGAQDRFTEPAVPEDVQDREGFSITESGQAILGELGRSYGFKYENSQWSWSTENVAKAFEEHPFWTTFDYATLALPVAKWGLAAARVGAVGSRFARGTSVAVRALERGQLAGEAPTRFGARAVGALFGDQIGRAAEIEHKYGMAESPVARFFESRSADRSIRDPEYKALVNRLGADPNDLRGINQLHERELLMEQAAWEREGAAVTRAQDAVLAKDDKFGREAFTEALTRGLDPEGFRAEASRSSLERHLLPEGVESSRPTRASRATAEGIAPAPMSEQDRLWFHQQLGIDKLDAYQKTFDFRLKLHEGNYNAGRISREAYELGLKKYFPRMWAELKRTNSLSSRVLTDEEVRLVEQQGILTQVLDPGLGVAEMVKNAFGLARQNYTRKTLQSAASKSGDELLEHAERVLLNPNAQDSLSRVQRAAYGEKKLAELKTRFDVLKVQVGTGSIDPAHVIAHQRDIASNVLGWKTAREWFQGAPSSFTQGLPDKLLDRFIDPAIGGDLKGLVTVMQEAEQVPGALAQIYYGAQTLFKLGKTANNPATQVRQMIGNVFYHWATIGGSGVFGRKFYSEARAALHEIASDAKVMSQDAQDVLAAGQIGTGHAKELLDDIQRAFGRKGEQVKGLGDFLTKLTHTQNTWAGKNAVAIDSRMQHAYRFSDDMVKADALLARRDHWKAALAKTTTWAGVGTKALHEEALGRAAADVAKFQPMFSQPSPFTEMISKHIPFSSYATEAARVFKNILTEKPHIAFAMAHVGETLSQVMGAAAGFSVDDIEHAKAQLPDYVSGKRMLMIPWRIDGKPQFMDLSYMIPMGTMADVEMADQTWFNATGLDPFANPVASVVANYATGSDPFTGRPVEPRFTEEKLGIAVEGQNLRKAVGLAEHMARMMLPPLVPPGYAGVNLVELMSGQRHAITGQELESNVAKTLAANLAGVRLYSADAATQLGNVRRREKASDEEIGQWWDRWSRARANGGTAEMREALTQIRGLRRAQGRGKKEDDEYLSQGMKSREPGKYRTTNTRDLVESIRRIRQLPLEQRSHEDRQILGELMARYQERKR